MDEKNPYQVRGCRQIYDNPWITVREHAITTPSGREGIYGVVEFKNQAVGVVPYEAGRIWLVGQYRFPLSAYSWEIPEGGAPHDEAPEACAHRELLEETGLRARRLDKLFSMHLSNSVSNEIAHVFLARELEHGEAQPEDTEQLVVRPVTLSEALALVLSGEITDSMSVAAVFRLELMRREGQL
ncbi:MAG TPA: NUDIX hydrolase [Polyangiaceae bacterium]|nr:NUDIX hydrolase [Polyangiaceae bacterium]